MNRCVACQTSEFHVQRLLCTLLTDGHSLMNDAYLTAKNSIKHNIIEMEAVMNTRNKYDDHFNYLI